MALFVIYLPKSLVIPLLDGGLTRGLGFRALNSTPENLKPVQGFADEGFDQHSGSHSCLARFRV